MNTLNYTIDITAPKEKVWHTMLDLETYEVWASAFAAGSTYKGSWDKGNKIQFVSTEDDGQSGISGQIVENVPYEYVSVKVIGEIVDGEEDTTSEDAKIWVGARESYRFTEENGITTVEVELSGETYNGEIKEMFDGMWPNALSKLKEITEQASS